MAKQLDPTALAKKINDFIAGGGAQGLGVSRYTDPANVFAGLSYAASEVVYHASGGIKSGLRVHFVHTVQREIHCFLVDRDGKIIDATSGQYRKSATKCDYTTGHTGSFVSTTPSARAKALANLMGLSL